MDCCRRGYGRLDSFPVPWGMRGSKRLFFPAAGSKKEYGKAETMMIVTSERLRYEELYTSQIWTAAVDNRGTTVRVLSCFPRSMNF